MATSPVDFESNLLGQLRSARSAEPAVETPASSDVTPAPEPSVEPAPSIESAPAVESTSPVEAAPAAVKATEGDKPSVEPTPASDVPTTSAFDKLVSRYGGDSEKAASAMLEMESRLASLVKEQKSKEKAQQATDKQPEAAPASPEPTPVTAPVVAAPQFAASAPALQTEPTPGSVALPQEYEQEVARLVAADTTCRAIAAEYKNVEARLSDNTQLDENNWVVGGRMFDLNNEIAGLQRALEAPSEVLKKHGFEVPSLDAIQRQDLESRVQVLKGERRDLIDEFHATAARRDRLRDTFHDRANQYRSTFEGKALQAKAEADQLAAVDQHAEAFKDRWIAERDSVYKANNVSDGMRPRIEKLFKQAAQAHITENGAIYNDDLPRLMADVVKEELAKADEYHRERSADYAKAKLADVQTATPAPPAAAAVATPDISTHGSLEERLGARLRAVRSR